MKNRILVLNVELSGMNRYLFSHLRKRGWELTVIDVPLPKLCKWLALISSFRPDRLRWKRKFSERLKSIYKERWVFLARSRFCQRQIERLSSKIDIIFQVSGMFAPSEDLNKIDKPYVTFNDYTTALARKYPSWIPSSRQLEEWMRLEDKLYKNASLIFTTNENARKSFINDYNIKGEKVITVGCGLNLEEIPDIQKKYDGKTILFIGIFFDSKGGYVLLDAFKKVRKVIPDARLIIAGPNKELFNIQGPGIEMLGYITDKEKIRDLYKEASIFVMPSLAEPFGQVFLEAMAYKLPCIGTTVDAIPEIIKDGKTGFLVPPDDALPLADKIIQLLQNNKLMKEMGSNGYLRVKERHTWDSIAERVDFHLRQFIDNRLLQKRQAIVSANKQDLAAALKN